MVCETPTKTGNARRALGCVGPPGLVRPDEPPRAFRAAIWLRRGSELGSIAAGRFAHRAKPMMSAYDLFVLVVAGANGGMLYYAIRRREQVFAWIKVKARRR